MPTVLHMPWPRPLLWFCLAGTAALLAGCGSVGKPPADTAPASLVWPPAPDQPRIAYIGSFTDPASAGATQSGFKRFASWLIGGPVAKQSFAKPFALALDDQANLLLTDTEANIVGWLDRTKKKWHRWERVGKLRFSSPVAVAKRGETVYVADSGLGAVVAFDIQGELRFVLTNGLARPSGLAIGGDRLLVADSQLHGVVVFDLRGNKLAQWGRRGTGAGEFNFPTHITVDGAGRVYVTDSMNSRVQVLDAKGAFVRQIGSPGDRPGNLRRPKGVAVDALGHVYVIDALFDNFQIFNDQGQLLLAVGEAGHGAGEFWLPNAIAIDGARRIYVADSFNHRVQVFQCLDIQ